MYVGMKGEIETYRLD